MEIVKTPKDVHKIMDLAAAGLAVESRIALAFGVGGIGETCLLNNFPNDRPCGCVNCRAIRQAVADEMERCCRDVCPLCATGALLGRVGDGHWEHCRSSLGGIRYSYCLASPIRGRTEAAKDTK